MLYTSQSLPPSLITLDEWQLVKVSGIDSQKFLQGQFTADVSKLTEINYLFGAHCDPKGKVWSNLLLIKRGEDIYYIERKSVLETQLKELKKYAAFSKVTIETDSTLDILGVFIPKGKTQQLELELFFSQTQNCVTNNGLTYLKIEAPAPRYIIIGNPSDIKAITFPVGYLKQTSEQWMLLDMEANYPIIDLPVSNQFLPQAFNLQNFEAISFDKGCYCGQEMVARAQYRGINKRSLYLLTGSSNALPQIGDTLEQQMDENWRETGCILATLKIDDDRTWIQAVLSNDLEANTVFRIKHQPTSYFTIKTH